MIELRWLHKTVNVPTGEVINNLPVVQPIRIRTLQYRDNPYTMDKDEIRFSDPPEWQDVPEVEG